MENTSPANPKYNKAETSRRTRDTVREASLYSICLDAFGFGSPIA